MSKKDYHYPLSKDTSIQEWIITLLEKGANPSLQYHRSIKLLADLALQIKQVIGENPNLVDSIHNQNIIHILIKDHDYRLVADFLYALRTNNLNILNLFKRIIVEDDPIEINKLRYQLAYARFVNSIAFFKKKGDISFVASLEEVLSQSDQGIAIYLINPLFKLPLIAFLDDVGVELGTFIEQQYDFPGLNALVRQGVVKMWFLSDGTAVVSKRNNPQKRRRFNLEQHNYEAIMNRMGGQSSISLSKMKVKGNIWLKIAQPFAVLWDGHTGSHYSLSIRIDGTSLEDLLLNESNQAVRYTYLTHYRLILDALYEKGIIWGDMSPRNILVQRTEENIFYHIFDFEKTQVMDKPISIEKRREHCRGQICVEELSTICTPNEVQECFQGYFNPKEWDFESEEALPFTQRPEVADILNGRGIHNVTLGKYNQTDHEMMNARIPDINPVTGERRFPGQLNFKVEHYLSCAGYDDAKDYERKTTEILIAAKRYNCFDTIVALLTEVTNQIESAFLKAEFESILERNSGYIMPPQQTIEKLVNTIDVFYHARKQEDAFRNLSIQWVYLIEREK